MSDRNVFRLKAWTHLSPKPIKGQKAEGVVSLGYKAEPGRHVVVLLLGAVHETEELTIEKLVAMLDAVGLRLKDEAAITSGRRLL